MNSFFLEVFDDEGKKCTFYTVRWTDSKTSETAKFFQKFVQDLRFETSLNQLTDFIFVVIGDEDGALEDHFRFENQANALPPKGKHKVENIIVNFSSFPLRLYCIRLSENIVILLNGAEKTSQSAQRGKTSMVFNDANQFAKRIDEALRENEIYISEFESKILNSHNNNNDEIVL